MKVILVAAVLTVAVVIGEAKRCRSSDECEDDECCIGRGIFGFRKGDCRKLAQRDEPCEEEDDGYGFFHHQYMEYCPCASGLSCKPTRTTNFFGVTIDIDEKCVDDISITTPVEPEPQTEEPQPETEEPEADE